MFPLRISQICSISIFWKMASIERTVICLRAMFPAKTKSGLIETERKRKIEEKATESSWQALFDMQAAALNTRENGAMKRRKDAGTRGEAFREEIPRKAETRNNESKNREMPGEMDGETMRCILRELSMTLRKEQMPSKSGSSQAITLCAQNYGTLLTAPGKHAEEE